LTRKFTIGATALIIAVDVLFATTGRETISEYIYELSQSYPIIAAAFGVLLGHWFWPIKRKQEKTK
jgi:hypothetical protein